MTSNTTFEIRVGLLTHEPTHEHDDGCTPAWGTGATKEEALENLIDIIRANAKFRRVLANGQRFFVEEFETLPKNIFPETHGLLIVDAGKSWGAYEGHRRFFLVRKGTIAIVEWNKQKRIEISDDPTLVFRHYDDGGYQIVFPEGSMKLTEEEWVECDPVEAPEEQPAWPDSSDDEPR